MDSGSHYDAVERGNAGGALFLRGCQSAEAGLLVEGRQVVARLLHHVDHSVKAYAVRAVGKGRIEVAVQRPEGGVGVALDTGYLYHAAYGVAGHAEVMLQRHLGGVFYLGERTAEQVAGRGRRHGASCAHFALATDLGPRDGCILLDDVAEDTGRAEGADDAYVGERWAP